MQIELKFIESSQQRLILIFEEYKFLETLFFQHFGEPFIFSCKEKRLKKKSILDIFLQSELGSIPS